MDIEVVMTTDNAHEIERLRAENLALKNSANYFATKKIKEIHTNEELKEVLIQILSRDDKPIKEIVVENNCPLWEDSYKNSTGNCVISPFPKCDMDFPDNCPLRTHNILVRMK